MESKLKSKLKEADFVMNAVVKEVKGSRNAQIAKVREWKLVWGKLLQECLHKWHYLVKLAKELVRRLRKESNVRNVMARRFFLRQKPLTLKFQKEHLMKKRLSFLEKEINSQMLKLETSLLSSNNKNTTFLKERVEIWFMKRKYFFQRHWLESNLILHILMEEK